MRNLIFGPSWAALALFLAVGIVNAQNAPTATLIVRADAECKLTVDGEAKGTLRPDDRMRVVLQLGEHLVEAVPVAGGKRCTEAGYFVAPTVFGGVEHEMRISQEEIFGPVATVIKFKDEEDALRLANGTVYSLAAGIWSADIGRVQRFARRLKAGTVWVNTFGPTDIRLPWGGSRDSGFGREHGDMAIENFTETKVVWINTGA